MAVLAILALLGVMVAAPANAKAKPISGKMYLELVFPDCVVLVEGVPYGGTWAGTVDIRGTTYGWADFAPGPPTVDGKFIYFEEYWKVFSLEGVDESDFDAIADAACATDPLMDGTNTGWGSPGLAAKADGVVATAIGPFADVEPGARMLWRGKVQGESEDQFKATLHIH